MAVEGRCQVSTVVSGMRSTPTIASLFVGFSHHVKGRVSRGGRERRERTGPDGSVDEPPVLLPLDTHATRVLPVARVGLVHLVEGAETEAVGSVGNVLAEGPPDALLARDPAFTSAIGSLCVNVYWIYARPSARVRG